MAKPKFQILESIKETKSIEVEHPKKILTRVNERVSIVSLPSSWKGRKVEITLV